MLEELPLVVFVKANALDYVLKPLNWERFRFAEILRNPILDKEP